MISRRRFLSITAAAVAAPAMAAPPTRWRGVALGAEVSLTFYADPDQADLLLAQVKSILRDIEAEFSLYDPNSALSQLNRTGRLQASPRFTQLMRLCDDVHRATNGLFDPTIQPVWAALATGKDVAKARAHVGWHRVRHRPGQVTLEPGQALTFNGIAQGFATDLIRDHLAAAGLTHALINMGEFAAIGGPFQLGLADPDHGLLSTLRLTDRAVATSSPAAQMIGGQGHILHPSQNARALWSTASVTCDSAALADAASTAFCLMPEAKITQALSDIDGTPRAHLVTQDGQLRRLHGA